MPTIRPDRQNAWPTQGQYVQLPAGTTGFSVNPLANAEWMPYFPMMGRNVSYQADLPNMTTGGTGAWQWNPQGGSVPATNRPRSLGDTSQRYNQTAAPNAPQSGMVGYPGMEGQQIPYTAQAPVNFDPANFAHILHLMNFQRGTGATEEQARNIGLEQLQSVYGLSPVQAQQVISQQAPNMWTTTGGSHYGPGPQQQQPPQQPPQQPQPTQQPTGNVNSQPFRGNANPYAGLLLSMLMGRGMGGYGGGGFGGGMMGGLAGNSQAGNMGGFGGYNSNLMRMLFPSLYGGQT